MTLISKAVTSQPMTSQLGVGRDSQAKKLRGW